MSASPGNGSKLAVLNRSFDWGIVVGRWYVVFERDNVVFITYEFERGLKEFFIFFIL